MKIENPPCGTWERDRNTGEFTGCLVIYPGTITDSDNGAMSYVYPYGTVKLSPQQLDKLKDIIIAGPPNNRQPLNLSDTL